MCFTSSVDAKQFLNENSSSGAVALVMCSMMMPGLSGMQVIRQCVLVAREADLVLVFFASCCKNAEAAPTK